MKNRSSIDTEIAPVDSRITITGAATRGTAPYKYAYYYKKAAAKNWKAIGEEFTDAKTASIKLRNEGDYIIKVCVKDSTGAMVVLNGPVGDYFYVNGIKVPAYTGLVEYDGDFYYIE